MPIWEVLVIIVGSGCTAAFITGFMQIKIWKLNRKAAKEDKEECSFQHVERALKVLLYDRLQWLIKQNIETGFITAEGLRGLLEMYECYHELKGNGLLENMIKQVKNLPIR